MFVLAHLSDLHLAPRPRLAELAGKRGLGFINWHRGRKIHPSRRGARRHHRRSEDPGGRPHRGDRRSGQPVAARRIRRARAWLDALGPPPDVTVIPGNHDIYVPGALDGPSTFWGDYMRGDNGAGRRRVPVRAPARRRGADRAVLGAADGAVPGDRPARREPACTLRRGARPHPRAFPDRAHSSSAGEPAAPLSAPPDRRRRISPRARGTGRRARAARSRPSPLARLARRAAASDPRSRRAVGLGARRRITARTPPATISCRSTARRGPGAANSSRASAAPTAFIREVERQTLQR